MENVSRAAAQLFARQVGLATVSQLDAVGVTRGLTRSRLRSGEWVKISRTVVGSAAIPMTWKRRVVAAWLDAGIDTAVSHATAARLHGLDGFSREESIHITACGGRHRTSSLERVVVHSSTLLAPRSCAEVDGIKVVPKPVALIQIATTHDEDAVAKAMDSMLRDGDSPGWIGHVAAEWERKGAKTAPLVLRLLHERVDKRLPRSWFQRLAKRLLKSRNVRLVDEYPVRDPETGKTLAELDLAHPGLQIGVECQSWKWHGTPAAQVRDARRRRRLRLLGWEIVDVWWADLHRLDEIVGEVEFLLDRRSPRLIS